MMMLIIADDDQEYDDDHHHDGLLSITAADPDLAAIAMMIIKFLSAAPVKTLRH